MKPPEKQTLTESLIRSLCASASRIVIWDRKQAGLGLRVSPSGTKSFVVLYRHAGRCRWFTIGDARRIALSDARDIARKIAAQAVLGSDPQAEKVSARTAAHAGDTLAEVCGRYLTQVAQKRRAWRQGQASRERYLLPKLGSRKINTVARPDIETIFDSITAKGSSVSANLFLAHASALFAWAVRKGLADKNPCVGIERNATTSRDRVLEGDEVAEFWNALTTIDAIEAAALKIVLLLGQRPGEVQHMRQQDVRLGGFEFERHLGNGRVVRERASGGWWTMPGEPDPAGTWRGVKNGKSHRVWLPQAVVEIIAPLLDGMAVHVFHRSANRPIGPLARPMRAVCDALAWKGEKRATPHDLRRSHGTCIASLGFGREALNRIENHTQGGIASVYDRARYEDEDRRVQEAVCARLLALAERRADAGNVVEMPRQPMSAAAE